MKIISITQLALSEVKVIRFGRFLDSRGYFTEPFRASDFKQNPALEFLKDFNFVQSNESYSRPGTVRGLHFQWNPYVGKLVRTVHGHMADMVLDIRKNSPNFGKAVIYDMPQNPANDFAEWIWVPVGFAHGNFYLEETRIEYLCTGEYNPACEAGISPLSPDIDWSLADAGLRQKLLDIINKKDLLISAKDRNGLSVGDWVKDPRAENFLYA